MSLTTRSFMLRLTPWRLFTKPYWLLLIALVAITLSAIVWLQPAPATHNLPGQLLATDLAASISHATGVQHAYAVYIPGDTLMIHARLGASDRAEVRSWALVQIAPFADELLAWESGETMTWVIEFGADPVQRELVVIPLRQANNPDAYHYRSAESAAPSGMAAPAIAAAGLPASGDYPQSGPQTATLQDVMLLDFNAPDAASIAHWHAVSGSWSMKDGLYAQRDPNGYDFLSMFDLAPKASYAVEVKMRMVKGTMGGGIIYNAPSLVSRAGAQLVDLDKQGTYLRWGHYDQQGAYQFDGGAQLSPPIEVGTWHLLRIEKRGAQTTIFVDGRVIQDVPNSSPVGYVGLSTSQAEVEFDTIQVSSIAADARVPSPMIRS